MAIWTTEIIELEKLYESLKGQLPDLVKELERLIQADDENMILLYSRRCLEVIITDLCECELKRPRKTEPLKGIIDKLNKEEKVPSHIITSMHGLNELATYGAHPKDFNPEQVKPVLNNLDVIIKWYLSYKDFQIIEKPRLEEKKYESKHPAKKSIVGAGKHQWKKAVVPTVILGLILVAVLLIGTPLLKRKLIPEAAESVAEYEKSIAVLPFINDSPDQENTYFINGVMEEILNNLQKIKDLRVISRTSVEQYRDQRKPISEIAEELGVNYIVEGSGQKYGNAFRLRAQLINAERETHLWGESFQQEIYDVKEIFIIQTKIAESIAAELKAVISPVEKQRIDKIPATDLAVYDEYQKARSYSGDLSRDSLTKALEFLNSAVEKDPDWAPLYTGLTQVWMGIQQMGYEPPSVAAPKIYENLNKAIELDPDLAEVHYFSAMIAHLVEWNWEKSEKEFLKALAINPNNSLARIFYSQLLAVLHRNDEALAQGKLAYSLDPLNPNMKVWYAATLMAAGDFKTGLSLLEEVVAVDPGHIMANNAIIGAAYMSKEYDKVLRAEKYLLPFLIGEDAFIEIERIYGEHGIALAYDEIMKHLEEYAQNNPISPMDMAFRYIIANQPDKAMDCIEKGFEIHDPVMIYIATKMLNLDPLFKNPRFIAICDKMNLPIN